MHPLNQMYGLAKLRRVLVVTNVVLGNGLASTAVFARGYAMGPFNNV
jgi:hypothetical protein